ncbi:hypothetical protein LUX09_05265 [Streptomyces albogriseolus]|nr:hypothetical protein [Streptomyces albogriseolus]
MAEKTKPQTAEVRVFRVRETGARVTVTDGPEGAAWLCSGCGHGRTEAGAVDVAEDHARHCAVLSL